MKHDGDVYKSIQHKCLVVCRSADVHLLPVILHTIVLCHDQNTEMAAKMFLGTLLTAVSELVFIATVYRPFGLFPSLTRLFFSYV